MASFASVFRTSCGVSNHKALEGAKELFTLISLVFNSFCGAYFPKLTLYSSTPIYICFAISVATQSSILAYLQLELSILDKQTAIGQYDSPPQDRMRSAFSDCNINVTLDICNIAKVAMKASAIDLIIKSNARKLEPMAMAPKYSTLRFKRGRSRLY